MPSIFKRQAKPTGDDGKPLSQQGTLARQRDRWLAARRWRDTQGYDQLWRDLIDLYAGDDRWSDALGREDRIKVNIAFSTINVIFPAVSVNYPKILVWARKPEHDDQALVTEAVINYWWRHTEVRPEFRRAVKDFLVLGHGWLKVGWRYVTEDEDVPAEELDAEFARARAEADLAAAEDPAGALELPTDDDLRAQLPSTREKVVEDAPFVERVDPLDIYVDPEATSESDMRWIAQRLYRPLEDVRNDERYDPSVRAKVKATSKAKHDDGRSLGEPSDPRNIDTQRVEVIEFYDVAGGTMCVFADGVDGFLVKPTKMPYAFGHPFVMLRNYDVPNRFYPMGDLEAVRELQLELNKTRSEMMNARKRYRRKYLYRAEAFGPEGRAALRSEVDNTMVPVEGQERLDQVVRPLPQEPMAPEAFAYSDIIESDIDIVTGVSEYARGATPEIRRTATEAAIIQDASNARAADKLATVEQAIANVARRLVQLAQQYLTGEQVARVVGRDGQAVWVPFGHDDIEGEFDFDVEAGSTQPKNETFRQQQAINMVQVAAPFIQMGVLNPVEVARHLLQNGFGITNPDRFLGSGQPAGGPPGGPPLGAAPGGPAGAPPDATPIPNAGPSPEDPLGALTQLQGQVGLDLQQ